VRIAVPPGRFEQVVAQLLELAPSGFVEEEGALVVYTDAAGLADLNVRFDQVEAAPVHPGWEYEWRRFHVPVVVGPLWVGPPWQQPQLGLLPVVIDPGRAFGTGAHETTRLCLELLVELDRGSFLDVGCGSGVLAIAAARLGFAPVVAFDVDDAAVDAARRNATANGVDLEVKHADATADPLPAADVVAANVTLETVDALGSRIETTHLIASGYLVADEPRLPRFRRAKRRTGERFAADLFVRE
jgi:ribosomal protein L11 methyltransferase